MKLLTAVFLFMPVVAFAVTPSEIANLVKERSLKVKLLKQNTESLLYQQEATKRSFFPRVTLTGGFSQFYPDFKESWNQSYSLGVTAAAEPVNFQRLTRLKIDAVEVESSEEAIKEELLSQLFLALRELYTLKGLKEKMLFKEESLKAAEEILKVAEDKYKKGLVMITDVLKARSEVERVKGELSQLRAKYRNG